MSVWLARFDLVVLSRYVSRFLLVLVVLVFGWQIGSLISYNLQPAEVPVSASLVSDQVNPSQSRSSTPEKIISIYLLGRQLQNTSLKEKNRSELVTETKLNLKVLGVLSVSEKRGVAIIQSGSQTLLVATGEKIQSGVFLEEVHSEYVVIDHNGVSEKLAMISPNEFLESNRSYMESKEQASEVQLEEVTRGLRKSPATITQYVRFQIINSNGKMNGIKVWPKKADDTAVFNGLGFESGDLLKRVNGQSVDALIRNAALWKKMLNETTLDMEVERQGRQEFFVVNLN